MFHTNVQQCGADMRQLFLQDQAYAQPGYSSAAVGQQQRQGSFGAESSSVGWGGQALPDNNGYRVPWFGRNRSKVPAQRQRSVQSRAELPGRDAAPVQPTSFLSLSVRSHEDVMSVEELVQVVRRLGRTEPLPDRLFRALHHLDSRAVALLLKDLSKSGLDARSIELFDALRSLPERHLLKPLCDVYTYTAMISLCIYQQNVDRAMELVTEMRARGVERNVHTYTALMNVCIKCGKLPSALEVFHSMKSEGCTPNVVTYNTLIDVYGKLGQWDRAVHVLKLMRDEGVAPALRTFNTLIIACNMCNQPREALAVYQELQESGFEANSTTYNALISAYGKMGQLDRVLEVYKDMVWQGLERSVITYSSLISACEKAGRWETALQLFEEMQRDGCTPNTVTYNSLITACGQGAQCEKAQQVFEQMQEQGCTPDVVTYTALISTLERGGQWQLALESFTEMVSRGCRPDAIVYNAIIDTLWQTGVVWAQAKARELYNMAVKQGHFRNERMSPSGNREELNLHALTAGVAMLSLHSWLDDIQHRVLTCGDHALPPLLAVVTDAGNASKEQGNFIIKEAVSTMMSFWGAPFRSVQDKTYLGVLEAQGPQLAAWARSTAFSAQMGSLLPTLASNQSTPQLLSSAEATAQTQCGEAFGAVQRFEASHNLVLQNMGLQYLQQRMSLISGLLGAGAALGLKDEVVHDGVLLLDRLASIAAQMPSEVLPLVAAAALLLALTQGAGASEAPALALAEACGLEAQAIVDMSWRMRQLLNDDTLAISTMRCLKVYLERMGYRYLDKQGIYIMAGLPIMLAVEALLDMSLLNCRPSVIAAALLYAERRQRGAVPFWPSMLAKMTGYQDLNAPELACAVRTAQKLCRKVQYTQIYKAQSTSLATQQHSGGSTPTLACTSVFQAANPPGILHTHSTQRRGNDSSSTGGRGHRGTVFRVSPVGTGISTSTGMLRASMSVPVTGSSVCTTSSSALSGLSLGSVSVPVPVSNSQLDYSILQQLQQQQLQAGMPMQLVTVMPAPSSMPLELTAVPVGTGNAAGNMAAGASVETIMVSPAGGAMGTIAGSNDAFMPANQPGAVMGVQGVITLDNLAYNVAGLSLNGSLEG